MRMWEYRPGNDLLQQIELWENFHRGKHIWSGDVDNVELNIAVTGGADGKVRVHDLTQQDRQSSPSPKYHPTSVSTSRILLETILNCQNFLSC